MAAEYITTPFDCVEMRLPATTRHEAFRSALSENPQNVLQSSFSLDTHPVDHQLGIPSELALNSRKFWENGRTLRIRFLGGSAFLQKAVRQHAETWLEYANIKFEWVTEAPAQIQVAFMEGNGSWSYVGTDCQYRINTHPLEATMNFGWLKDNSEDIQIRQVVLHEFGHALGCEHEHQSPLSTLNLNIPEIQKYYRGPPNNWDDEKIQTHVLDRLKAEEVRTRKFDPDSIMLYEFEPSFLLPPGGEGTKRNTNLSEEDKAWIKFCYPFTRSNVGAFTTLDVRDWKDPDTSADSKKVLFSPAFEKAPNIALGLTWLDLDFNKDICIEANSEDITKDNFRVKIDSGLASGVFSGACSWLQTIDEPTELQSGTVDIKPLLATAPAMPAAGITLQHEVTFPTVFNGKKASVVVWFSGLQLSKDHDWKVNIKAVDLSNRGFTVRLNVGSETVLQGGKITWIAYPTARSNIASGSFSVGALGSRGVLPSTNAGVAEFAQDTFSKVPNDLVLGICGLDFGRGCNLRLRLTQTDVNEKGFSWSISTWLDSKMYGASAQYLALVPSSPSHE